MLLSSWLFVAALGGVIPPLPLAKTRSETFVTSFKSDCTTCYAQNWGEMGGCIESAPADCAYTFYVTVPVYTDCYRDNFITFRYYTPSHNYTNAARNVGKTKLRSSQANEIIIDEDHYDFWYNLKYRVAGMQNQTFTPSAVRTVDLRDTATCSFHSSQTLNLWSSEGEYIIFRQVPEDTVLQLFFEQSNLDLSQAHMEIIGKYMHDPSRNDTTHS